MPGGSLTVQALNDGTIDIGLLFTSDPAIQQASWSSSKTVEDSNLPRTSTR